MSDDVARTISRALISGRMAMACLSIGTGGTPPIFQQQASASASGNSGAAAASFPPRFSSSILSASRGDNLGSEAMQVAHPAAANANIMWFGRPTNASIVVNEGESPESIVRRFRREVMNAGVIAECRRRRFFETPQDVKKRKEQVLRRRKISRKLRSAGGGGGYKPPYDPFAPKKPAKKDEDDDDFWGSDSEEVLFK